jgi:NAD(P)-dependent dehydrogenase (short-subunit alcohol dehydrogenase family)
MSPSGVILIIGAGANLGRSVALKFASNGYRVAIAARSLAAGFSPEGYLNIKCDLADPSCVPSIFQTVEDALGPPNIVVFNGSGFPCIPLICDQLTCKGANRLLTPPKDPLAVSLEILSQSRKVGLDSAYVAAQEALRCFKKLPSITPTAFIYTGNALSQIAIPGVLPFALGKVAAAMLIEYTANAYGEDGYRFDISFHFPMFSNSRKLCIGLI